jgi:hypothetical protein
VNIRSRFSRRGAVSRRLVRLPSGSTRDWGVQRPEGLVPVHDGVNRGKRLLRSAGVKAVYRMNLRGSEGGRYFGRNVPARLRAPRHLSRREGVVEARRFQGRGKHSDRKAREPHHCQPRFDSSMRGVLRGMPFGKGASSHIPLKLRGREDCRVSETSQNPARTA